jgi:hypothetical protein
MKIKAKIGDLRAMKQLRDLQSWYERGFRDRQAGTSYGDLPRMSDLSEQRRSAYLAGREDAAKGRPMTGVLNQRLH